MSSADLLPQYKQYTTVHYAQWSDDCVLHIKLVSVHTVSVISILDLFECLCVCVCVCVCVE